MNEILIFLITFIVYSSIMAGICLVFLEEFHGSLMKFRMRNRLKTRKKEMDGPNKLVRHLDDLTGIAFGKNGSGATFIWITGIQFTLMIMIGMKNFPMHKTFMIALLMCTLPYLMLRIKIETIRRKSSYEGEGFIGNFLSQYRLCNFNIFETMETVVRNHEETKVTNKLLLKLMMELRITGNPDKIKRACETFSYAIHTNWGNMLAYNINLAAVNGINVSRGLEDILIQLREARTLVEERKRLNGESSRMITYLIPVLYLSTILVSTRLMGMKYSEFIRNQFFSEEGFTMFLVMIFMLLINIVVLECVNNQRFDF